ncbi:laccase domain protein [Holospora obtusa F1]|uniref:Laccase domain protein n=1 Tax=Holospora obtusa F1 TaxID=1399147 RepID=W6TDC0_HOLOB|nr:polyphenol oxidase family protein [Holospora obtusa]ETZ06731.1 laccase domain protein [Holospora obtusa F1]
MLEKFDFSPSFCAEWKIPHGFFPGMFEERNLSVGYKSVETYLENRRDLVLSLNMNPNKILFPYQTHGCDVVSVTNVTEISPVCDGLVTNVPGIMLCISTADCGPVMFWDGADVVGICHAGWKGTLSGILENTLDAARDLSKYPEKIQACLGPTIRCQHYEVSKDFYDFFILEDPKSYLFFKQRKRLYFDLPGYINFRLLQQKCILVDTLENTYESRFFSRRQSVHQHSLYKYSFGSMIGIFEK